MPLGLARPSIYGFEVYSFRYGELLGLQKYDSPGIRVLVGTFRVVPTFGNGSLISVLRCGVRGLNQ